MTFNAIVIGGSRHIGYYTSLRLLAQGSTVTFLLRTPQVFDNNETIQGYVKSGHARLVQGDTLIQEDVDRLWAKASAERPVDLLLSTIGFTRTPSFHLLKGFGISPPNLVTQTLLNVLSSIPKGSPLPKVITLSATGVSRSSRQLAPSILSPIYGYLIARPLQDKFGAEKVISHCAGWEWNAADGEPGEVILGAGWEEREGLPAPGMLEAVVLRAALLTDGKCWADEATANGQPLPYRVGPGEVGGYAVSRKDVAHFIVEGILKNWEEYGGKQLSVAY